MGMYNYKVIFAGKMVFFCAVTTAKAPPDHTGHIYYRTDEEKKRLTYAIIKAESEADAVTEAEKLIEEYYML
jgi:hypothetical protein